MRRRSPRPMPEDREPRSSPDALWYGQGLAARALSALLAPLGGVYCAISALRAFAYRRGWLGSVCAGVPVIVVGNLTVGGTGKTPLVLWLVDYLRERGLRPGVATRGYGGGGQREARLLPEHADPLWYGDEPVLLAARGGCPVAVGRDRVAAARLLVAEHDCDVLVTDDGLQHYRLRRDCEILVVDGMRGFGNGRCLPAGPLREPRRRARRADLRIVNGGADAAVPGACAIDVGGCSMRMTLVPGDAVNLHDTTQRRPLAAFRGASVTAIAGIGNPRRFFSMLREHGLQIRGRAFPDHHRFSAKDLASLAPGMVLMTEKDAVKCLALAKPEHWYVPVQAQPDASFVTALNRMLDVLSH
jgi:tetraacyldisaccharide 4'-kinase